MWQHLTWWKGGCSAGMAEGCRHGLVAQAELGAAVVVVSSQHPPSSLPGDPAPVVPALQMLRHQGLMYVLGQQLISGPLSGPWRPHRRIGILGQTICLVAAVVPESVVSMVAVHLVGRVDVVVALHFVLIHVGTVWVRLHLQAGVAGDVVGTGWIVCWGLAWITTARMVLHQVGHAPGVSVHFHLPVETVHGWGSGVQRAVLGVGRSAVFQTGLAGVGRAVLQHLCAVAAVRWWQDKDGLLWVGVLSELGLGLQTATAVPEAMRRPLRPAGGTQLFKLLKQQKISSGIYLIYISGCC